MEIASEYEIATANLACALATDTVSDEHRNAIRRSVTDIDRVVSTLNLFIVSYCRRLAANEISAEKAALAVSAEYRACGLPDTIGYAVFKPAVDMFFNYKAGLLPDIDSKLKAVLNIFGIACTCQEERIKDAMQIYCLRLLNNFGLVTHDIALTKRIISAINAITEERKAQALMPPVLLSEL